MPDSEDTVRYVATGAPTGWAAMAKVIRDVDEDKIKDCKEDIDTLLVFIGLFSAVLSAFVIVSYQSLSPDKTDRVIQLLTQISAQTGSYSVTEAYINSTVLSSTPSVQPDDTFTPSSSAIRVNILWSASLTLSLMTASFGILVKQWLREYLALDYTSPQERLRSRQFRHPGLAQWKVYEIAGILPLLLQLSLGLFFIGLCYFTWSIHASVGCTTTPIVAGWAFLYLSATISPIFSARCPYKTALLKVITVSARQELRRLLFPVSVSTGLRSTLGGATLGARGIEFRRFGIFNSKVFVEEGEAVKEDRDELAILIEADALLLDDELLGTTMWDSLAQHGAGPSQVIEFVLQALNNRLKEPIPLRNLTSFLDLRHLSKRGWAVISDMVANTVIQATAKQGPGNHQGSWFDDAIFLLLSKSDHPLTPNALTALLRCMENSSDYPRIEYLIFSLASQRGEILCHLLRRLRDPFEHLQNNFEWFLVNIVKEGLCTPQCTHTVSLFDPAVIYRHGSISDELASSLIPILLDRLRQVMTHRIGQPQPKGYFRCHLFLLSWPTPLEDTHPEVLEVVRELMDDLGLLCDPIADIRPLERAVDVSAISMFKSAFRAAKVQERHKILSNVTKLCNNYGNQRKELAHVMGNLNLVRLVRFVAHLHTGIRHDTNLRNVWQALYRECASAVNAFRTKRYDSIEDDEKRETIQLAEECLSLLESLDSGDHLVDGSSDRTSLLPDELFEELMLFAPEDTAVRTKRVKRLQLKVRDGATGLDGDDTQ